MFRALLLSLTLLTPAIAFAQNGDAITPFSDQDQTMNAAMDEALVTLPLFLANATDAEGYNTGNSALKVAFDTSEGPEIIWVAPFAWDGNTLLVGLLANQPNFMGNLNAGDRVEFSTEMVRDWSFVTPAGEMFGNYTTRVMIPELDEATAASLSEVLSDNPVPADWN